MLVRVNSVVQSILARTNHILKQIQYNYQDFLADLVKVDSTFIEDHSFKIAQLPTESEGGGLRVAEDVALSALLHRLHLHCHKL